MKLLEIVKGSKLQKLKKVLLKLELDNDEFYKRVSSGMIDLFLMY